MPPFHPAAPAAAILFLAAAAAAPPPDRPFVVPQRDADITYAIPAPPGAPALSQRMRFDAAHRLQRVDPPGGTAYMITDYPARTLTLVQPALRSATVVPAPGVPLAPDGLPPGGSWTRGAADTVAGLSCTDWTTADASGNRSTVCYTAGGLLLRARQDGRTILEARTVSEAPLAPDVFAVPAGFSVRRANPPAPGN